MKNRLFFLLRILISFFLIGLLLWLLRDKLPEIIHTIKDADRRLLLTGFLVYLGAVLIMALRLQKVISVQEIDLSLKETTYLTFMGYFFNNFLPTSIGGDLVKAYYAGKKTNQKGLAFAGIFMDRFLAMIPFTLIPAFTLLFYRHRIESRALVTAVYMLFFLSVLFLWLILHKNTARYLTFMFEPFKESLWHKKLRGGYGFLNIYSRHKLVLLWSFFLSLIAQAMWVFSVYFFAGAVGVKEVGLAIFFIVVPIVGVISMLPSLNGLGIREGAFVYLLKAYMLPEKAFAVSILVLASLAAFSIIGGVIYAFKKNVFSFKMEG